MRALDDPDVPVTQIGRIVEQDVAIAAKVMQLVNSAFFGGPQEITTIQRAVSYLGVDLLKQLVVTAEIFHTFQPARNVSGFSLDRLQGHSQLVAALHVSQIAGLLCEGPGLRVVLWDSVPAVVRLAEPEARFGAGETARRLKERCGVDAIRRVCAATGSETLR